MGNGVVELSLRYAGLRERCLLGSLEGQTQRACQSPPGYAQLPSDLSDAHLQPETMVSQRFPIGLAEHPNSDDQDRPHQGRDEPTSWSR